MILLKWKEVIQMEQKENIFNSVGIVGDIISTIQMKLIDEFFLPIKEKEFINMKGKEPDPIEALYLRFDASDTYINYFLYGHCNVFAQILAQSFEKDLEGIFTDTKDIHVISKICNHYYDVRGQVDNIENIDNYIQRSNDEIKPYEYLAQHLKEIAIGNYDGKIDKYLIELGIAAAKERIHQLKSLDNINKSESKKHSK